VSDRLRALNLDVVPASFVEAHGAEWAFVRRKAGSGLAIAAPASASRLLEGFEGETTGAPGGVVLVGPASPANAAALRRRLDWLRPRPLGTRTSAGLGDRLGLATPGHVRAVRAVGGFGAVAPVFAQQSVREMTRTGRTPADVMDAATWGMFAEGWREGTGADADHLKTTADIDACLAAGFSMFTIDPGEHVDPSADGAGAPVLRGRVEVLPWADLADTGDALRHRYLGQSVEVEHLRIAFDEETLLRAAVKYGRAVAHVARMARHLRQAAGPRLVEIEVSVDETETPTSPAEHYFVANELNRLEVAWVGLAPRFVGRFEKGVDYIGDLAGLEKDLAAHAALARHFGPYKLSLHSGSDKFSVYPIAARLAQGLVHLKTAGTSYLEALRTVAALDPAFFRAVYVFARERYDTDKASYHVSADLGKAPLAADVAEPDLPGLLEHFDAREILHVTFGSVLTEAGPDGRPLFKDRLLELLRSDPERYAANLERHFVRHLKPFAGVGP
jgi:tagaturonate epimerase